MSSFSSCGVVKYAVDLFFLGYLCPRPPGTQVERNSPGHPLVVTSGVPCSLADEGYIYKLVSAVCRVSPNPPYASMSEFVRVRYRPLLITMSLCELDIDHRPLLITMSLCELDIDHC